MGMNEFPLLLPPEVQPFTKHPLLRVGLRVSTRAQFAPPVHHAPHARRAAFARLVAPCAPLATRELSAAVAREHAPHERYGPALRVADRMVVVRQVRWAEAHVCPELPRELLVDALLESRTTNRRAPGERRAPRTRTQEALLDEYRAQVAAAEEAGGDGDAAAREETMLLAEQQFHARQIKAGLAEEALNHHLRLLLEQRKMLGGAHQDPDASSSVYHPRLAVFAVAGCTYAVAPVAALAAGIYLYRESGSNNDEGEGENGENGECGSMKLVATVDLDRPLSAVYTSAGHDSVWDGKDDEDEDEDDEDGQDGGTEEERTRTVFVMLVSGGQCLMLRCHKKDTTSVLDVSVVGSLGMECGVRDAVVWRLYKEEEEDDEEEQDEEQESLRIAETRCHAVLLTCENTLMLWEPHVNRCQSITLPAPTAATTNAALTGQWLSIQPGLQPYSVVLASTQCVSHISFLPMPRAVTVGADLVLPDDLVCTIARHPRRPFLLLVCTMEMIHLCDLRALAQPLVSIIHVSSGFSTAHWLTTTRLPGEDAPALWSSPFVVYTARENLSVQLGAVHCDRQSLVSPPEDATADSGGPLTTLVYSLSYTRLLDDIFRDPVFRLQKRFEFPNEITGVAAVPCHPAEQEGLRDTFVLLLAYSDGSVYAQRWDTLSRDEAQRRREHPAPAPISVTDAMPRSSAAAPEPPPPQQSAADDDRKFRRYSAASILNRIAAAAPASTVHHDVTPDELAALAPAIRERLAVPTTLADLARFVAARLQTEKDGGGEVVVDPLQLRDAIAQCHELDWMHSFVVNDMSHACTDLAQCTCGAHNEASRDAPYRLLLYAHPSPSEGMPLPQKILPHYRRVQQEAEKYAKRYPDKYVDPEEDRDPNETDEEAAVRDAEQKAATMSEEEIYEHLSQHLSQSQELHPPPAAPARIVETHPESHSSSSSRSSSSSEDDLLDSQPLPKKQHADGAPEQDVKSEKTKEAITASRFGAMSSSSSSSSENGSSSESDNAPSSFFTQESFFGF